MSDGGYRGIYEGYRARRRDGRRTPVAIHDGPGAARVAEALANIAAADIASWRHPLVRELDGCGRARQ